MPYIVGEEGPELVTLRELGEDPFTAEDTRWLLDQGIES